MQGSDTNTNDSLNEVSDMDDIIMEADEEDYKSGDSDGSRSGDSYVNSENGESKGRIASASFQEAISRKKLLSSLVRRLDP